MIEMDSHYLGPSEEEASLARLAEFTSQPELFQVRPWLLRHGRRSPPKSLRSGTSTSQELRSSEAQHETRLYAQLRAELLEALSTQDRLPRGYAGTPKLKLGDRG